MTSDIKAVKIPLPINAPQHKDENNMLQHSDVSVNQNFGYSAIQNMAFVCQSFTIRFDPFSSRAFITVLSVIFLNPILIIPKRNLNEMS